ncbi:hypothetical protein ASD45_21440 [Pseudolabrys sp. Root1462]|uniref:DUF2865 domain-containing protein n=1 Tax=Pseudolabrys sp. Root1462 TaxID=1736466 RepID=UPI000703975A|nr:DUF2865 domain-containing protein [Pseudolabrys sp. Root1462]KQY97261.1 hypothetical protein ASD45_21440 [Pseudolabrys sp. Root1462]
MARASKKRMFQALALGTGLGVVALLTLPAPASAGFFDRLFGSIGRAIERPAPAPTSDPFTSLLGHIGGGEGDSSHVRAENSGPAKAFCVRSCDGHYFPVVAHAGMSAADACHSFCPAAETKLFVGSDIDYATTNDGSRYADLPNAYAYRKKLASGCTCNGRTAFGLAHIDATTDPTLRPGDIVATETGLMAFTGKGGADRSNVTANFTPVQDYAGLSKAARSQLGATKVARPAPQQGDVTSSIPQAALNARAEALR